MAQDTRRRAPRGTAISTLRRMAATQTDDCTLWPYGQSNGYGMVALGTVGGRQRTDRTHAVVCAWYHGERPSGTEAAHRCGVKLCVNPRHLRWATPEQNAADKILHGTTNDGERNGNAKLTVDDVVEMRRQYCNLVESLAVEFGVSANQVKQVLDRRQWRRGVTRSLAA